MQKQIEKLRNFQEPLLVRRQIYSTSWNPILIHQILRYEFIVKWEIVIFLEKFLLSLKRFSAKLFTVFAPNYVVMILHQKLIIQNCFRDFWYCNVFSPNYTNSEFVTLLHQNMYCFHTKSFFIVTIWHQKLSKLTSVTKKKDTLWERVHRQILC